MIRLRTLRKIGVIAATAVVCLASPYQIEYRSQNGGPVVPRTSPGFGRHGAMVYQFDLESGPEQSEYSHIELHHSPAVLEDELESDSEQQAEYSHIEFHHGPDVLAGDLEPGPEETEYSHIEIHHSPELVLEDDLEPELEQTEHPNIEIHRTPEALEDDLESDSEQQVEYSNIELHHTPEASEVDVELDPQQVEHRQIDIHLDHQAQSESLERDDYDVYTQASARNSEPLSPENVVEKIEKSRGLKNTTRHDRLQWAKRRTLMPMSG